MRWAGHVDRVSEKLAKIAERQNTKDKEEGNATAEIERHEKMRGGHETERDRYGQSTIEGI